MNFTLTDIKFFSSNYGFLVVGRNDTSLRVRMHLQIDRASDSSIGCSTWLVCVQYTPCLCTSENADCIGWTWVYCQLCNCFGDMAQLILHLEDDRLSSSMPSWYSEARIVRGILVSVSFDHRVGLIKKRHNRCDVSIE
jgi:hypothetical protein